MIWIFLSLKFVQQSTTVREKLNDQEKKLQIYEWVHVIQND